MFINYPKAKKQWHKYTATKNPDGSQPAERYTSCYEYEYISTNSEISLAAEDMVIHYTSITTTLLVYFNGNPASEIGMMRPMGAAPSPYFQIET